MSVCKFKEDINSILRKYVEPLDTTSAEKLGELMFEYRGTHGLSESIIFNIVEKVLKPRCGSLRELVDNGFEVAKKMEIEKYGQIK
jgi:hypothetical protein